MSDNFNGDTTVNEISGNGGGMSEIEVIRLGMDICSELDLCAKEGLSHGIISEENIFVYENGIYTLGDGEETFDAGRDIRSLGEVMYILAGGNRGDSQEDFEKTLCGLSDELARILQNACAPEAATVYKDISDIKKDLMTVYAAKYFDGIDVSVSDEVASGADDKASLHQDVRRMKKNTDKTDFSHNSALNDTILAGDVIGETEYSLDGTFDDAFYEDDDDTYRAAIEAGASVTAAAKILHGQKTNKKRKSRGDRFYDSDYDRRKKAALIAVFIIAALLILAIIVAIPIVGNVLKGAGNADTTDSDSDIVPDMTVARIEISSLPEKLSYRIGDKVDASGLVLAVTYESGAVKDITGGYTVSPSSITESGTQEITVSYSGFSVVYSVEAYSEQVESIIIMALPDCIEYERGQTIDFTGIKIDVLYSDGLTESLISGFSCSPQIAQTVGEQDITVSYEGKEAIFKITVKEPSLDYISLRTMPEKTEYTVGQSLSTKGFSLTAHYTDGTKKTITKGYTYTPAAFNEIGRCSVTVSYEGKTLEFFVTVKEAPPVIITGISVSAVPQKTSYNVGQSLLTDGLSLEVRYSDGSKKTVSEGFSCSPVVLDKVGKQTVTVTYEGKITQFDIDVTAVITGVEIKTLPLTTTYMTGDSLDTSGLSVLVKYSDGSNKTVTEGFSCTPTVLDEAGKQTVTVTYGGKTAEFEVIVNKAVSIEGDCGSNVQWELTGSVLTISGSGEMNDFEEHSAPWSQYSTQISKIVVEDGVVSVGQFAFAHTYAKSVNLGKSVREVGNGAFYNCKNLTAISVSDSNRFFSDVNGVLLMGKTTLIAYPIGRSETSYTIPRDVTAIGGYRVFYGSNLREIVITQALYSVDETAFVGALKLEKFTLGNAKSGLEVKDGVLYTKNFNALICYPAAKAQSSFTIPDGVGVIRENAFAGNRNLAQIVLPPSLYRIDANAFADIKALNIVTYRGDEKAFAKVQINEGNEAITNADITFETAE